MTTRTAAIRVNKIERKRQREYEALADEYMTRLPVNVLQRIAYPANDADQALIDFLDECLNKRLPASEFYHRWEQARL